MGTRSILTISAILLAAMLFISPAWGESSGDQRLSFNSYEEYIDEQIRHNEFKASLGSPSAPNLQKIAEISREKVEFLKAHGSALARNMEADNVEKKPYKMTRYLNRTFYDSIRGDGALISAISIEKYKSRNEMAQKTIHKINRMFGQFYNEDLANSRR